MTTSRNTYMNGLTSSSATNKTASQLKRRTTSFTICSTKRTSILVTNPQYLSTTLVVSDNIDDPLTRNATLGFINNFGQIPAQLFKRPHPQRKLQVASSVCFIPGVTTPKLFYHSLESLRPSARPVKGNGFYHESSLSFPRFQSSKVPLAT